MSDINKICVCTKNRANLNFTNCQRYIDNCKSRKIMSTSRSITTFFSAPTPKKSRLEVQTPAFLVQR